MLDKIKDNKNCIIAIIIALLIGRFALQPKAKIETKVVEKLVEKIVEVEKTNKKVNTKIVEKKNKDGSSETVTVINEDTTIQKDSQTDIKMEKTAVHTESNRGISLGIMALEQVGNFKPTPEFGITAAFPIFGSVSVTALATTEKRIGLGISVEF